MHVHMSRSGAYTIEVPLQAVGFDRDSYCNLYEALRFAQQKTFTIQYFPVIIDHRSSKIVSSAQGNLPYNQARSSDSTLEEVTYRPERLVDAF